MTMIADLKTDYLDENSNKEKRYDDNFDLISSLGNDTLLIFDNYNVFAYKDKKLSDILNLECDVLFTSRLHYDDIAVYHLKTFRKYEYAYELIQHYYPFDEFDIIESQMHRLVLITDGHPFSLDLCGRQLKKGLQTPESLADNLCYNNGKHITTKISAIKDGSIEKDTFYDYISKMYFETPLSEIELYVLSYMRFSPSENGVNKMLFMALIGLDDPDIIEGLVEKGLIFEYDNGLITLSVIIRKIIKNEIEIQEEEFVSFFENLLSCDTFDAPEEILIEMVENCTPLEYLELYNDTPVIALHSVFQFYYKIKNTAYMESALVNITVRYDKNDPEQLSIFEEDRSLLFASLPDDESRKYTEELLEFLQACYECGRRKIKLGPRVFKVSDEFVEWADSGLSQH